MLDDDMEGNLLKAFQERESVLGPANQYLVQQEAEESKAAEAESDKMVHEWLKSQGMGDTVPAPADYDYARMLKDGVYPKAGDGGMPLPPKYWKPGKMIIGGVDIATGQRIESQVPAHDFHTGIAEHGDDNAAPVDLGEMWSMITQDDLAELSSRERRGLEAWMESHGVMIAAGPSQTRTDAPTGYYPKQNRPPTLDDLKQRGTDVWDVLAGALKGGVAQTLGLPGDVESLIRMLTGGEQVMPTTEDMEKKLPPVIPPTLSSLVTGGGQREANAAYGETAGEFIGLGKAPTAIAKGVVKGAKVLAPTAKEMTRKGIERVVDSTGARLNMVAYHGTPHNWSPEPNFPNGRPKLDNIGTGEGAQAYGWGFYSAETKGVASYYKGGDGYGIVKATDADGVIYSPHNSRQFGDFFVLESDEIPPKTLSGDEAYGFMRKRLGFEIASRRVLIKDPQTYWTITGTPVTPEKQAAAIVERNATAEKTIKRMELALGWLDDMQKRGRNLEVPGRDQQGNLFHLDIPDEIVGKMMLWDAPLSAQPENVKKAIKQIDTDNPGLFEQEFGGSSMQYDPTGEDLYLAMRKYFGNSYDTEHGYRFDGQKMASTTLKDHGVPGNKYLDGNSRRGSKGGTYNYVVWDQDVLDETAKRGIKKVIE